MHAIFQLAPETLFLSINILDRYCWRETVSTQNYPLAACVALRLAAKYEETRGKSPTLAVMKSIIVAMATKHKILHGVSASLRARIYASMEWNMLETLGWRISLPTVSHFIATLLRETDASSGLRYLAGYISETMIFHRSFLGTRPSLIAVSSLNLAGYLLHGSRDTRWKLRPPFDLDMMATMLRQLKKPSTILFQKYASQQYSAVSIYVDGYLKPHHRRPF